MATHLVLGAGGIGRSTADALANAGHDVVLASRSGRPATHPGVRAAAFDVQDVTALTRAAHGSATIVNALNPTKYTAWDRDWPPLAAAILTAAQESGASLITVSNLYLYGYVDAPMTEQTRVSPNGIKGRVRAQMWAGALAAHNAGRVRATEVRASDYLGPATLTSSMVSSRVLPAIIAGKQPSMPYGRVDVPHSWTADLDVARLITAIVQRDDDGDWGRPWHVPTDSPTTVTNLCRMAAQAAGVPERPVKVLPRLVISAGGLVVPLFRALWETRHHYEKAFVIDSSAAQERFGLAPTPTREVVAQTIAALKRQSPAPVS